MMFKSVMSQQISKFAKTAFMSTFFAISLYSCTAKAWEVPKAALSLPLVAQPGSKFITPAMLLELGNYAYDNVGGVVWLDKDNLLYTLPARKQPSNTEIKRYNLNTQKSAILTEGSFPLVSPDGRWIAFVKGEGTAKQLWVMDRENKNNSKQLAHIPKGLGVYRYSYNFIWASDSKKLILSHQEFMEPWEKKPRLNTQIEEIDVESQKSHTIGSIDGRVDALRWLPNSQEVLLVKERESSRYNESKDKVWIQALNPSSGAIRTLVEFDGLQQFLNPVVSPNGKTIAIQYDAEHPKLTHMLSVGLISVDSDITLKPTLIQQLTHEMQIAGVHWTSDAKNLIVLRQYGAYGQLYQLNIETGRLTQLTKAPLNITRYTLSPDDSQIAYFSEDAHGNYFINTIALDGSKARQLIKDPSVSDDVALSEVREIEWKTKNYPVKMRGLLIMPLHYKKGKRYPLIVDIHGGDVGAHIYLAGGILVTTPLEWQMWAAKGYAVFVPEFRSSLSFGTLALDRDIYEQHDRLGGDLKDIEAGVDYLINKNIADKNRLAILGHSAGGLRANWFLVSTHRYQSIVSKEGWADELTLALNHPLERIFDSQGGSPQEVPENYIKNSPLYFAEKATTPTLFLMGNPELGGADEFHSVYKLYQAINKKGIDAEYVDYPDEGHLLNKQNNKKDALDRIIKWMDGHLKPT